MTFLVKLFVVYATLLCHCSCHLSYFNYFFPTKNQTITPNRIVPSSSYSLAATPTTTLRNVPALLPDDKMDSSKKNQTIVADRIVPSASYSFLVVPTAMLRNVSAVLTNDKTENSDQEPDSTTIGDSSSKNVLQKHEFDYETVDDSDKNCRNGSTGSESEQEIDETSVCEPANGTTTSRTTTTTHRSTLEIDETTAKKLQKSPSMANRFAPKNKLPVPKIQLPISMLPKQRTVTITHTIIKPYTVYSKQYHSCVLVEGVTTWCENADPESAYDDHTQGRKRKRSALNYEIKITPDEDEPDTDTIRPTSRIVERITKTNSLTQLDSLADDDALLVASEMDYDFEEVPVKELVKIEKLPTTTLTLNHDEIVKSRIDDNFASMIGNVKIEFINRYISSTETVNVFDKSITATVVARHCIPRDSNLPFCENSPSSFYFF